MSDYSRANDFSVKDGLTTGDPNKKIKGSEVDADFDAIVTAIATKANKITSPTDGAFVTQDSNGDIADGGTVISTYAQTILDDANEAAFKATVNLEIGTDVQAWDAELDALAAVTSAADKVPYFTGSGTADVADLSSFGRTVIDDADAAAGRVTLGALRKFGTPLTGNLAVWNADGELVDANESGTAVLQSSGAVVVGDLVEFTSGGDVVNSDYSAAELERPRRNWIDNGNFQIWQRGSSFTFTAGQSGVTADRWRGAATAGSAQCVITEGLHADGSSKWLRAQMTPDATGGVSFQTRLFDEAHRILGKTMQFSVNIACAVGDVGDTIRFQCYYWNGSAAVYATPVDVVLSTSVNTKYTGEFVIPSYTAWPTGAHIVLEIWQGPGTDVVDLYMSEFYLAEATTGMEGPIEVQGYAEAYNECARYTQVFPEWNGGGGWWAALGSGPAWSTTQASVFIPSQTRLLVSTWTPTATGLSMYDGLNDRAVTSVSRGQDSSNGFTLTVNVASGLTAGTYYQLRRFGSPAHQLIIAGE